MKRDLWARPIAHGMGVAIVLCALIALILAFAPLTDRVELIVAFPLPACLTSVVFWKSDANMRMMEAAWRVVIGALLAGLFLNIDCGAIFRIDEIDACIARADLSIIVTWAFAVYTLNVTSVLMREIIMKIWNPSN
jgi:hypothetical protein